jgi:hypothetical protein
MIPRGSTLCHDAVVVASLNESTFWDYELG